MNNSKVSSYSTKIKRRIRRLWFVFALILVYMVVGTEMGWVDTRYMTDLAVTVSTVSVFGGLIYVVTRIIRNKKLLNDKQLLLSKAQKENDERQQFLHDKSGGFVVDILLLCLLFITCTAALTNMAAFNVSFTILAITLLLKIGSYTIYNKNY